MPYRAVPGHQKAANAGCGHRFASLERWQVFALCIVAMGAAGGVLQLSRAGSEARKWSSFYQISTQREMVFELQPGYRYRDEAGRFRRLHQYLGEFNWRKTPVVRSDSGSFVDLWLLQLANFTYNHDKASTSDPVWQSVKYTWQAKHGVCRDSATVLADMLGHEGYDARLTLGYVMGPDWGAGAGGHAWVALRDPKSGHEYFLESTGETASSRMRTPPRVATCGDYFPEMQVMRRGYYLPEKPGQQSSIQQGWTFYEVN